MLFMLIILCIFRTVDKAAYTNLARVLVQRCLESGLTELQSPISTASPDTKVTLIQC